MAFILDIETHEITEFVTTSYVPTWLRNSSFNIDTLDIKGHINKAETFIIVKTRSDAFSVRYYLKRGGKCSR